MRRARFRLGNFGLLRCLRRWRVGDYYRPCRRRYYCTRLAACTDVGLVAGAFEPSTSDRGKRRIRVLIPRQRFIGNHLTERLLNEENYE